MTRLLVERFHYQIDLCFVARLGRDEVPPASSRFARHDVELEFDVQSQPILQNRKMPTELKSAKELEIQALLSELSLIDSRRQESLAALVCCIAQATGCPMAVISLLDANRIWYQSTHGIEPSRAMRGLEVLSHALLDDDYVEVADAPEHSRYAHSTWVTEQTPIRFHASVPLRVGGYTMGSVSVLDHQSRMLDSERRSTLWRLARVAGEILESHRHVKQLQHERERMGDFARASGDWMWEVDANLRCTWVSDSFEGLTKIPVEQVIGSLIEDSPLLDARGEVIPDLTFLQLLARHQPFVRITNLRQTPCGPMQVSRSAVPRFDAQGRFIGFRGTARDVSESIRIHQQLAAQDQLLRKLSSQVPGVIFQYHRTTEGNGRYLYASDAVGELLGLGPTRPGQVVDSSLPFRLLHPDDKPGFLESLAAASREVKPWLREYRVRLDDGRHRWMETRASPEKLPDGSIMWHGFTADITERKQIELALRESQDRVEMASAAAGIGIVEIDLTRGVVVLDHRAQVNHGLQAPRARLSMQEWLDVVHPDDRDEVGRALRQALSSGEPLTLRYRACFPDGSTPSLEMLARAVPNMQGQADGLVGTCRDVSAALISERLQTEKAAAERANRAKSEFLSRVSHELRTPLNGILGFAQLMQLDRVQPLEGDQRRRLESVLRAGRHLLDLINEVLDLSRIESEDFNLKLCPVNVGVAVQTCLNLVQPLADGLWVSLPKGPFPAVWVHADPRALEQVIMNLLSNAIKYNRPHGAVTITTEVQGEELVLSIRDEGLGLSAEQQASLFQPFNRLGAERTRVEGSGLGLVISKDLMRAMGGRLQVSSTLGSGATFSMVLALSHSGSTDSSAGASTPPNPVEPHQASQPKKILYIEDEPVNAVLMHEIFRNQCNWHLHVAVSGSDGLQAALELRPDLVLIDMNLPDMHGLTLLRQLRSQPDTSTLRCIALSADALPEQISVAREAGFSDYWTKPIEVNSIMRLLHKHLAD